ncbi:hypothetical protein M885DRAFT_556772 [Pelagophyceae sp. CCMP2097]|nr:hypothetical protein M885DRAFT_556772 [Pelagophyceae sp. CCMP2097]
MPPRAPAAVAPAPPAVGPTLPTVALRLPTDVALQILLFVPGEAARIRATGISACFLACRADAALWKRLARIDVRSGDLIDCVKFAPQGRLFGLAQL